MTPKFNLRNLILKIFQQLERYIAIKYKLAVITLKFNLSRSNSQNFPRGSLQIPHINKICNIKLAHKDYLDMSVIYKGPTFIICPGPHEPSRQAWQSDHLHISYNSMMIISILLTTLQGIG